MFLVIVARVAALQTTEAEAYRAEGAAQWTRSWDVPAPARNDLRPQRQRAGDLGPGGHDLDQPQAHRERSGDDPDARRPPRAVRREGRRTARRGRRPRIAGSCTSRARSTPPSATRSPALRPRRGQRRPRGPPRDARRRHRPQRHRAAPTSTASASPASSCSTTTSSPAPAARCRREVAPGGRSIPGSETVTEAAGGRQRPRPHDRSLDPVLDRAGAAREGLRDRCPRRDRDRDGHRHRRDLRDGVGPPQRRDRRLRGDVRQLRRRRRVRAGLGGQGDHGRQRTERGSASRPRRRSRCRGASSTTTTCSTDSHEHPDEWLSVSQILIESSNIGTIMRAAGRWVAGATATTWPRSDSARRPRSTSPANRRGILKEADDLWGSERVTVAYGQGVSSTSLQLVAAINTIANDGVYVAPKLVKSIVGPDGSMTDTAPSPNHTWSCRPSRGHADDRDDAPGGVLRLGHRRPGPGRRVCRSPARPARRSRRPTTAPTSTTTASASTTPASSASSRPMIRRSRCSCRSTSRRPARTTGSVARRRHRCSPNSRRR